MPEPQFNPTGIAANQSFDWTLILPYLDKSDELRGIRVVYYDGYSMIVLRKGPPTIGRDTRAVVIKPDIGEFSLRQAELAAAHEGALYRELLNTAVGCSAAVASWVAVYGAGAAVPLTGGTSLILEKLAVPMALAGTASCVNSGVRLYNETYDPAENDRYDQSWWYTRTVAALDVVGIFGAATGAHSAITVFKHLRRTTGKTALEILKGFNRAQRKALAEEAIKLANPGISWYNAKALAKAGIYPRVYSHMQMSDTAKKTLLDAYGAITGFGGSAYDGLINKGANAAKDALMPRNPAQQPVLDGKYVIGIVYGFETIN